MSALRENTQLYDYLTQHYSTTHYRFEKFFGHSFPYKKLDLDSITDLKLDNIENLSGIEDLPNLRSIEVKGLSDLSTLEKCPSLSEIKADLPEDHVNIDSILNLSQKEGIKKCEFYGRGIHSITSDKAKQFGNNSILSYDSLAKMTPEQFSKVQSRFEEIHSLIKPEMSEVEKVETIYRHLLPPDFQYDWNNHQTGSNGYLVNNTMYGPLVEHKGVCSGIAQALEHALRNEGLEAVSCGGWANTQPTAGDSHQWNQVKVDGQWYNLDLTNDYDLKSWRFFMKSDIDRDWTECHYADKEDKYEPTHDCTSTKYDDVYREDPKQRELRELRQQREKIIQQKINTPLSSIDDPEYIEYRTKVNKLLENKPEDEYLRSQFILYKNPEQQDRCYHTIQTAKEGQPPQTLLSQDFEYSDKFKKGMLEPSVIDFSRRNNINTISVTLADQPNRHVQPLKYSNAQPTSAQSSSEVLCNVNLMSENNNMIAINNIDQTFAQQIQYQAPQISPDIFLQQQAQFSQMQMSQAGPVLSLTMGSGTSIGGFINVLLISMIIGLIIGIGIVFGIMILG